MWRTSTEVLVDQDRERSRRLSHRKGTEHTADPPDAEGGGRLWDRSEIRKSSSEANSAIPTQQKGAGQGTRAVARREARSGTQTEQFGNKSAVKVEAGTLASCRAGERGSACELLGSATAGIARKTPLASRGF